MLANISKRKTVLLVTLLFASVALYFISQQTNFPGMSGTKPLSRSKDELDLVSFLQKHSETVCTNTCEADDIMCRPRNFSEWKTLFSSPALKLNPPVSEGTYIFPWEKDYLSFPPLTDLKTLPDPTTSTVFMSGENQGWVACDVGQRLTGRLDVRDGYGRQRQDGLDEVRLWIVDERNTKRRAVGQVTDFRNGSYGLEITCLWPGSVSELRVAVFYPREFIRAAIKQVNSGATRYTLGMFTNGNGVEEATVCHPFPTLPGRDCICNYTSFNTKEYYCGQPLDKRLNCSHWTATTALPIPPLYHVTSVEKNLIYRTKGAPHDRTLKAITWIKTSTTGRLPNVPNCSAVPRSITWDMTTRPQGFWDVKGIWRSLQCKTSRFSEQVFMKCLKTFHVYVIGDSNARETYYCLVGLTGINSAKIGKWPTAEVAKSTSWNITINYFHHDYPLFLGKRWEQLIRHGSVEQILDRIPSTGRHLVILHYYLHLTPFHLSVARSRLEAAARAISRLLKRNPEARVAFRGPHLASKDWKTNPSIGGDVLGKQYLDIISTAFKSLKDKVIFLDGWEMTIALENSAFHPSRIVPYEMIYKFMSFVCE